MWWSSSAKQVSLLWRPVRGEARVDLGHGPPLVLVPPMRRRATLQLGPQPGQLHLTQPALRTTGACEPARHRRKPAAATGSTTVVSVLVSFTPARGCSPASAGRLSALVRTLADGGERWCAVLESV
jgi:hypothetical protein